ncbi:MAG: 2-oxoacid:acceptor oxidoreductase family protein [Candidatus Goldbacteria bacterium]|nr:2-oxoacid:acceptor oxidoreductase family protein [Candidatus Goldiibacteriota bacterium]
MEEKIIIAGSGGQGVLTLGLFLCNVAISDGKNVTWLPAYGAEKRGGFSFCNVIISDDEIYSPVVDKPTTLIAFDQRAYETYKNKIEEKTIFIENSSLVKSERIKGKKISVPASDMAKDMNFIKGLNMIMAGVYSETVNFFEKEKYLKVMENMFAARKNEIIEKNLLAFNQGIKFVKDDKSDENKKRNTGK